AGRLPATHAGADGAAPGLPVVVRGAGVRVRRGPHGAFVLLIVLPLAAAWCTQAAARHRRSAAVVQKSAAEAMVPLTAATLAVVVAATIDGVRSRLGDFLGMVPVYVVFAVAMATVGTVAARAARLGPPAGRAVVFSG